MRIDQLAALSAAERARVLAELTEEEARIFAREWLCWARPEQLQPPGDWRV